LAWQWECSLGVGGNSVPDLAASLPPSYSCFQPPVQVYGIEGRYATALYSAASKEKKLDQVEKELLRVGVSSSLLGLFLCPVLTGYSL
jgi:hypothetical protein